MGIIDIFDRAQNLELGFIGLESDSTITTICVVSGKSLTPSETQFPSLLNGYIYISKRYCEE